MYRNEVQSILPTYDVDCDAYYLMNNYERVYLDSISDCKYCSHQMAINPTELTSHTSSTVNQCSVEIIALSQDNSQAESLMQYRQELPERNDDGDTLHSYVSEESLLSDSSTCIHHNDDENGLDRVPLLIDSLSEQETYYSNSLNQNMSDHAIDSPMSENTVITPLMENLSQSESESVTENKITDSRISHASTYFSPDSNKQKSSQHQTVSYIHAGGSMQSRYDQKTSLLVTAHSFVAKSHSGDAERISPHKLFSFICIDQNSIVPVRYCRYCHIFMPPRSFHCRICNWYGCDRNITLVVYEDLIIIVPGWAIVLEFEIMDIL